MGKFIISKQAQILIDNGFTGNGCGSKPFDRFLAKIATKLVGLDLHPACTIHDAEMSIPMGFKFDQHRSQADTDFEYNCIMCMDGKYTTNRFRVVRWFRALVAINTFNIYWGDNKFTLLREGGNV